MKEFIAVIKAYESQQKYRGLVRPLHKLFLAPSFASAEMQEEKMG